MVLVSQVSGGLDWILLNWRSSWGYDPHLGRCGSLGRVEAARPLAGYILMVRIEPANVSIERECEPRWYVPVASRTRV
eukprot:CAMPEP_0170754132 /NCGR_PEP_ID=MMETSP0437-20130122/12847_1 /TAXON_ID=0 /ORGANISM="Sexangularia sp." /LENGTH=77 /DNA_ID=CAMNT_0011093265 /DNA_START=647 /DNA_END=880 /DNA_ORIENTATION=-